MREYIIAHPSATMAAFLIIGFLSGFCAGVVACHLMIKWVDRK